MRPEIKNSAQWDDPSVKDANEVAAALVADLENGLNSREVSRQLAESGRNELRAIAPFPTWRRVLSQFQDPLIYLLLGAIVIALVAWLIEGVAGWPVDAIVIALVVVLNAILGYVQEAKAENAVAALARMTAVTSAVMRDGQVVRIPSAELVRGDLLVLGEGDSVGADARLHQAASLRVQEASLTGESEAVLKDASTLREPAALSDRLNMVFKGTSVAQGTGRAVVTAIGMDTQIGAIWRGTALPLLLDLARKPNFLHDSSVANLDDLLNPSRGSTAPHPFYFNSSAQRSDMIEFLRGLSTP